MKFCQKHWDALIEGVKVRKMWRFVPQSGVEVFENAVLELQGHGSGFDPLSGAMWQLAGEVTDNVAKSQSPGAAIACMGDPIWCPMCAIQEWWDNPALNTTGMKRPENAGDAQAWIDRKLDAALRYAREQGYKLDDE